MKTITFYDYKQSLFFYQRLVKSQFKIRSKKHQVHTIQQNKVVLSWEDDKRMLLPGNTDTLPWGYNSKHKHWCLQLWIPLEYSYIVSVKIILDVLLEVGHVVQDHISSDKPQNIKAGWCSEDDSHRRTEVQKLQKRRQWKGIKWLEKDKEGELKRTKNRKEGKQKRRKVVKVNKCKFLIKIYYIFCMWCIQV